MSTVARTPVHFPRMKVRGGRNRRPLRRLTWAFQSMSIGVKEMGESARYAAEAIRKFNS